MWARPHTSVTHFRVPSSAPSTVTNSASALVKDGRDEKERKEKKSKAKKVGSEQVVGGREDAGGKGLGRGGDSSEGGTGTNGRAEGIGRVHRPAATGLASTRCGSRSELAELAAASEIAMENQGGRNSVPARGGGRRGRSHNHPEPESPGLVDAAGDGHGRPTRNSEERNGRCKGGGGGGGRGGRHNGDAVAPRLGGPACESQVRPEGEGELTGGSGDPAGNRNEQGRRHNKEENGSSGRGRGGHRGSHSFDALQEIPLLGSRGGQPGRRAASRSPTRWSRRESSRGLS
jgi:hypothetical protein